jgi:uncharacterized Tic20 family protein
MESNTPTPPEAQTQPDTAAAPENETLLACLTHLMPLAGFVLPALGTLLGPILWWALMKDKSPAVRDHGPEVINFAISLSIYTLACIPLVFLLIGIPLLIVLSVGMVVLAIIGAVKAANGEAFRYPLILRFLKDNAAQAS